MLFATAGNSLRSLGRALLPARADLSFTTRPDRLPAGSIEAFKADLLPVVIQRLNSGRTCYRHSSGIHVLAASRDTIELGGKAAGLIRLASAGLPIPKTLLVSSDVLPKNIPAGVFDLDEIVRHTHQHFTVLSGDLRLVAAAGGLGRYWVIRSSGYEDSLNHSAAGIFSSTFSDLGAEQSALTEDLQRTALSGYSLRARRFLEKHGQSPQPIPIVVNELQTSPNAWSGSLIGPSFSVTVDTADPERICCELNPGLGTQVAEGRSLCSAVIDRRSGRVEFFGTVRTVELLKSKNAGILGISRVKVDPEARIGDDSLVSREIERLRQLLSTLPRDIVQFERVGLGVDVELCIVSKNEGRSLEKVFVQQRYTPKLQETFRLPKVASRALLFQTDIVIGQANAKADNVILISVPTANEEKEASALTMDLSAIEQHCQALNKPYLLVLDFASTYHAVRKASGPFEEFLAGLDEQCVGVLIVDRESGMGHPDPVIMKGHFAHYFKSERIPVLMIHGTRIGRFNLAEMLNVGQQQIGDNGIHYRLAKPLIVACDQRTRKGLIAY